jgi:hypothetical protein
VNPKVPRAVQRREFPKYEKAPSDPFRYNFVLSMRLYKQLVECSDTHAMTTAGCLKLMISVMLVLLPYLKKPGTTILVKDGDIQREIIVPMP